MRIPLIRPSPPRLSEATAALRAIEERGHFSNFGPVNTEFEQAMTARMFGGYGACLTTCNATIALMLAVQQAIGRRPTRTRYALMPAFTFAAAGQAALWCGLTPLFCDIDPNDWAASAADEDRLIERYGDAIAVVMPYASFGYAIDLARYTALTARTGLKIVVDAASSLGTIARDGRGFGTGFAGSIVFSMHATKSFATGEAGLIYSADTAAIAQLRQMSNFGFGAPRTATMPGLNGKLSETGALLGQLRLDSYDATMAQREKMVQRYRDGLPALTFQAAQPGRQAHQFASALLPAALAPQRAEILAALAASGIGTGTYFSPHLAQQPYFAEMAPPSRLPVSDDVAARVISLPLSDTLDGNDCAEVIDTLNAELACRAYGARPNTFTVL